MRAWHARAQAKFGGTVSADDIRPRGREIIDIARRARTPSNEDRDRVYQALMAGLGGATVVGTTKVATAAAKVAAKSSLAWLKWALPVAIVSSASVGTYVWTSHRHASPIATTHAVEATPQENTAPTTVAPSFDPALQPTALSTEPGPTHPSRPQP